MSYEDFQREFYNYVQRTDDVYWWQHSFKSLIKYRADILYCLGNDSQYALEHLLGKTLDQICKYLYDINFSYIPLDLIFAPVDINDTVTTKNGLIGVVTNISSKGYLTIEILGSRRKVKRRPEIVIKVGLNNE